jgi:hypothetical protein
MFNLGDYKTFVRSHIIGKAIYKKADVTEKLLEALFQFEVAPSIYLKDMIPRDSLSLKYKQIFDLTDKKNSIWLNYWFLFNFGYKHCPKCTQTKTLDSYTSNINRADKLQTYCKSCDNNSSKAYKLANPDKVKEKSKAYYILNADKFKAYRLANVDKIAEFHKAYYIANADRLKESHKAYRAANADKIAETKKAYQLANPDKCNALKAKYRAAKLCATPVWLTPEQHKQILEFYTEAKRLEQETCTKHHVDHIVPLQGLSVCGLHVPWNLQILTAKENVRKSNKWPS